MNKKIKVIHVISDANIGGAGNLLVNYLKNFNRDLFDIKVILPKGSKLKERILQTGYEVIETNRGQDKSFDMAAISEFSDIFKAEKPDIVHTHSSLSARIASFTTGVKSRIYTRHCVYDVPKRLRTFPFKQINGFINNTLATEIVAVAEAAKDNLTDAGVNNEKITVIINGVETLKGITKGEKLQLREKYGIKPWDFVVGISARLEDVKGHKYLIDAAKVLQDKYKDIKILIMGTGTVESELKVQARSLKVEDIVIFTGYVNNVAPLVDIMDVQINCSYGTEASSLALAEGMSLSKPTIATNYGGNPYMVTDGENGYLMPIKDSAAIVERIERLYNDRELLKKMSETSLEHYKTKFTAAIMTRKLEELYIKEMNRINKK